ncbi:PREDICTED: toll/interleukin-1 receptor-like protein [Camelina sativa]|uniref:Toll/interleukin-1 receptor-like protein n=1 Tax=Camelina sativa TaxID=90675 RepID=A0ABM0YIU8_CAMSA|nr:PREDICTED: toll/interleukin-1 receptor-like protein [Camelina sativa]
METGGVAPHRLKFEIFLSFRGKDTRDNFCERLYVALNGKQKVRVFRDNEGMKRGDEIGPSLFEAIEDSAACVIVLSRKYANSTWCLDELATLCDLTRSSLKRPMVPIFYGVDPSDVRKQSGKFAKHFEKHKIKHDDEAIQRWRKETVQEDDKDGKNRKKVDDMIEQVVKNVLA